MTVESTLYTRLSTFTGLANLVSDRIYPLIIPQGEIDLGPCVTFQRISTMPREVAMGSDPGIAGAHIQVTAWDATYSSVKAIGDQIRLALERYSTTGIFDTYIIGEHDLYDEEALKFGVAIEAQIMYSETAP